MIWKQCTYGFQPRSPGLMYRMPARDTVAGVAVLRWLISNSSLIDGVREILSLLASVKTLLSSITVFKDSIHIGSMSPSRTIHLGHSWLRFAKSRIISDSRPTRSSPLIIITLSLDDNNNNTTIVSVLKCCHHVIAIPRREEGWVDRWGAMNNTDKQGVNGHTRDTVEIRAWLDTNCILLLDLIKIIISRSTQIFIQQRR